MGNASYAFGSTTAAVLSGMDGTTVPERRTSMRLIDADRLSEAIYDNVPAPYEDASWAKENCLAEIEAAPTVDAVPVVRCRECKHLGFCGDATNLEVMGFYGYCSRGERKEGADNG